MSAHYLVSSSATLLHSLRFHRNFHLSLYVVPLTLKNSEIQFEFRIRPMNGFLLKFHTTVDTTNVIIISFCFMSFNGESLPNLNEKQCCM